MGRGFGHVLDPAHLNHPFISKVSHNAYRGGCIKWTLHQLRHSSLTHLGEAGVSAILLQAKSRHQDPRTLARYAKSGIEAVAALTAEFDRGRRHRQ